MYAKAFFQFFFCENIFQMLIYPFLPYTQSILLLFCLFGLLARIYFPQVVASSLSQCRTIPVEQPFYPILNFDHVRPAEGVEFAYVDEFAHGAVRFGYVKLDCAGIAYRLGYQLRKLPDGEFLACPDIDVTVADFAEGRDGSAAASAVVAVHHSVCGIAVVHAGVFLDADDVLEVYVQEHMNAGVRHVLAPEELTERSAGAPEGDLVRLDSVEDENFEYGLLVRVSVNDIADSLSVFLDIGSDWTD